MRRFRTGSTAILLALALVAGACSGDDDDDDAGGGGEETEESAPDVDESGVLLIGADLTAPQLGQLDPVTVDVLLNTTHEWLYGTLLRLNAEGEIVPDLAEEVEVVDPSTLVVTLRKGLTFTDGTTVDAEALKFSWERNIAESKPGGLEAEFREVESLTVDSPLQMTVKLKKPIAGAFFRLMRYAESSPYSPTAVKGGVDLNKTPIGAGPFKLETFIANQTVKFVKNPDYWDADNIDLAGIEFVNVTAQAVSNALRSHTIDHAPQALSVAQARELQGVDGLSVEIVPSASSNLIGHMCKSRPPLDSLEVRQALNYALDRDSLNDLVYDGLGEPMWGFNSKDGPFYDKSLDGYYETDVEKAKELLAEAGASDLSFSMFFFPGTDGQAASEVVQQQWAKAGIDIELKPLSNVADFFPDATAGPMVFFPLSRVGLAKVTRNLVPGSFGNVCNWDDPVLNDLVLKLQGVAETSDEGIELWKKISKYGLEKAVFVFGLFGTQVRVYNEDRVGGVEFYEGRTGLPTLDLFEAYIKA